MTVRVARWLLASLMLLTVFLYRPALTGPWQFDDHPNISENRLVQITNLTVDSLTQAAFSSEAGPLGRPVAMLSIGLTHAFYGLETFPYKISNLFIHLSCGLALYLMLTALLRLSSQWRPLPIAAPVLCLAVSSIWLLHPINLAPVLMVVQRMTLLSGLFTLLAIWLYLKARLVARLNSRSTSYLFLAFVICWPIALLSKENAILLPVFIWLIEWAWLDFKKPDGQRIAWLAKLYGRLFWLSFLTFTLLFIAKSSLITDSYVMRDFTLSERLLTESRILLFHLGQLLLPGIFKFSLFHDDIAISTSLLTPLDTLLATAFWLVAILALPWFKRRAPVFAFSLGFFIAGHLLESTVIALELVHEHRNYLAGIGPLFAAIYFVAYVTLQRQQQKLTYWIYSIALCIVAFQTKLRAEAWADPFSLASSHAETAPNSLRAQLALGSAWQQLSAKGTEAKRPLYLAEARRVYRKTQELAPTSPLPYLALLGVYDCLGEALDERDWQSTLDTLKRSALFGQPSSSATTLFRLSNTGHCAISAKRLNQLAESLWDNPKLLSRARGILASELLQKALNEKNPLQALHFAQEAINAQPNEPQHRLNLAALQLATGDISKAEQTLALLQRQNLQPFFRERLQQQQQRLAAYQKQKVND